MRVLKPLRVLETFTWGILKWAARPKALNQLTMGHQSRNPIKGRVRAGLASLGGGFLSTGSWLTT